MNKHASQPRAIYYVVALQIWEYFSFYGMRALLILYLTNQLKYSDNHAYELFSAYCSLVYVTPILGGFLADKVLGNRMAVMLGADAVIVHHGYFWKGESPVIRGMKRNRLKTLLANDINLYGWHLPLDAHPELGNNAQLAALLGITVMGEIEPLVPWGELTMPVPGLELASWIEARLGRKPLWCGDTGPEVVQRVAWCTGGGQSFIDSAARFGVDAFITGEVSEQTIHSAREQGLHFYAAGHHATERGGIRALSEWLNENTDLDVTFIDIPNPA